MKVISSKANSSRERVDVEVDLSHAATWRIAWEPSDEPGKLKAHGRHLVMTSRWGTERTSELWLTEAEAIAIARLVAADLLAEAAKRAADGVQNIQERAP